MPMPFSRLAQAWWSIAMTLACTSMTLAETTITFDDLTLLPQQQGTDGSYFDGYGPDSAVDSNWSTGGVSFNTVQFLSGFSYSNVNNTTDIVLPGGPFRLNQFAAITGVDASGSGNYVTVFGNSRVDRPSEGFPAEPNAIMTFDQPTIVQSVDVTNTTYSYLAMRNGTVASPTPPFGSGDFFEVIFLGYNDAAATAESLTGEVRFTLGDYRTTVSPDNLVDEWTTVALAGLGAVEAIEIRFNGSDTQVLNFTGEPGLYVNTPAYVALDNLSITAVPEPSLPAALAISSLAVALFRRSRNVA
ncbi:MAG: DUF4465 domain-containing protein [Planctomycetota bacterium]